MKKLLLIFLCLILIAGCGTKSSFDGKDRPSSRGQLQVIDSQLCGKDGKPVILRGISSYGVSGSERYISDETFHDLAHVMGVNVFRMALYTYGMGSFGYCTGGDKEKLYQLMMKGVELGEKNDMYIILDWHILSDGDPNKYLEDAKEFFDKISLECKDKNNVIYEICNEPNKVEWQQIKDYANVIIPIIRNNDPDSVIIVGTPDWSSRVDIAADDPLDYSNLLYALHFYSASHKQESRDNVQRAIDKNLPIYVSEYGITASTGNFPYDIDEANIWIDFLEENGISHVMWNFSKVSESSAAIKSSILKTSGFEYDDFSQSGQWLIDMIKRKAAE
ncbi:MAG: glycoside hydrolase family 5 protein [Erysipelotrichaceae bacterium]|nr:glycoside hydrolase family 5 protein [Erysipelotrichaceae bacterium]